MAAVVVMAFGGGCSSGGGTSISVGDLADAGDACPVDLESAATEAGLDPGPSGPEVEVVEDSADGGPQESALDRVGGVYVECNQHFADGEGSVTAVVVTAESSDAATVLGPQLVMYARLSREQLIDILERVPETDEGTQVDLGTDAAVVLVPVDVGGATSAMLLVRSREASPDRVEAIADQLLEEL